MLGQEDHQLLQDWWERVWVLEKGLAIEEEVMNNFHHMEHQSLPS